MLAFEGLFVLNRARRWWGRNILQDVRDFGFASSNVVVHHGLHAELSFDAEPRLHLKVGEAENTGSDRVGWLVGDGVKIIKGRKKDCF